MRKSIKIKLGKKYERDHMSNVKYWEKIEKEGHLNLTPDGSNAKI